MAYPVGSVETTSNGVTFVETPFVLNGKQLRAKTNLQTGASDFYIITVTGDKLIASSDAGNNWSIKDDNNLINALGNVANNLKDTPQKRAQYFAANYTLNLNNFRAQVLNTKYPDGTQTTFANTPGYGSNPAAGASGSAPATATGNVLQNLGSLFQGGLPDVGPFDPSNDNPAFTNSPLKYPSDLIVSQQDTFVVSQYEYTSPNKDIFTQDLSTILLGGLQKSSPLKGNMLGQVILPIPNNPQDSNNVSWGEDNMDAFTTAATAAIVKNPGFAAGGLAAAKGISAITSLLGGAGKIGPIAQQAGQLVGQSPATILRAILAAQGNTTAAKSALYSFILSKYGFEVSPESILSRGLGVIPNSNLQLLFNNVTLRSFSFSYMMSPRSKSEANTVNMILRFFKQGMAAKRQGNNKLYLGTPNVFKLEYRSGNKSIAGMNKFKICALTGFGVNYAPSGQWAAYEEGQPASVVMTMSFRELEPVFEDEYKSTGGSTGNPKVNQNEIGF